MDVRAPVAKLYKRGPCYYLDWRQGGERFRRSLGAIDRATAEAVQAEKEAEIHGLITPTRGITVGHVIGGYLVWFEQARPTSFRSARSDLAKFTKAFGHLSAEGLNPARVEQWEVTSSARGSANKALKLAKAAFRRAKRNRVIGSNPLDDVQLSTPPISRAPDYYRPEQLERLYGTQRGPLWRFMVNTGVRRGEMAKARREDVRDGKLYVESLPSGRTKSGRWRAVPLNREATDALKALGSERLVDCAHRDTLSDWFKADAAGARLPGTLHWLRHTFCTALIQSGVSLYDVKTLAGHSSITVTERYAHHAPGHGQDAVRALEGWSRGHSRGHIGARKSLRPRSSAG